MLFDLDLGVKVTQNVAQYPLHNVIYVPAKFEVAPSNGLESRCIYMYQKIHYLIFDLDIKVT